MGLPRLPFWLGLGILNLITLIDYGFVKWYSAHEWWLEFAIVIAAPLTFAALIASFYLIFRRAGLTYSALEPAAACAVMVANMYALEVIILGLWGDVEDVILIGILATYAGGAVGACFERKHIEEKVKEI